MKHSSEAFPFAFVPIAVLAAFAAPATAQLTTKNTRLIRPPVPGLPYTRTGTGDFDGDANLDVAYLCGNNLGVMVAPAIFEVTMNNITPANDFDVVSTHATARVLTVSNGVGLKEWRMETAPLFAEPDPNPPTWVWNSDLVGTTAWIGATTVRTWSVDPASTYIVALNAAGTALLALQRNETGGPPTWTVSWTAALSVALNSGGPVLDIVPFNLDGVGAPEVAVVRANVPANVLEIYRPWDAVQPAPVTTVQGVNGYSYTASTLIHHAGQTHEWLGWVITQNLDGVTQSFMTYGYDGWKNILLIGSALHVYTLRAARLDADEDDDLLIGMHSGSGVAKVFNTGNSGGAPKFSLLDYTLIEGDSGIAASSNQSRPFVGDLDGDGDCDFGFPIRNEDEMWIGWNSTNLSTASQPLLVSHPVDSSTKVAVDQIDAEDLNHIHFQIDTPPVPGSAPLGPRYLEVKLYSMKYDPSSSSNYAEPTAFSTERILVPGSVSTQPFFNRDVLGAQSTKSGPGFDRIVYITAQCVVAADATSNPTWAGPCMMAIVQGQDEPEPFGAPRVHYANRIYVDANANAGLGDLFELEDKSIHNGSSFPSSGASVGNGGYVPCIPVRPERPPRS